MKVKHVAPVGAIQAAVEYSGKSKRQVSVDAGYVPTMLARYTSEKTIPNIGIMAKVAAACGMTLQLTSNDEVIVIDPPTD